MNEQPKTKTNKAWIEVNLIAYASFMPIMFLGPSQEHSNYSFVKIR